MKIKRSVHNKMFKHRQLKFYQYSTVSEFGTLECYYRKWFLILTFVPLLIICGFTDGFPSAIKELISLFREPYSYDGLTRQELKELGCPL